MNQAVPATNRFRQVLAVGGRRMAWAMAAVAASLAAAPAGAQELALMASSVQRCLVPTEDQRAKPAYPEEELRMKRGASVEAEFVFTAPDRAPRVVFTGPDVSRSYQDAVEAYAKQLRVPCMSPGTDPVKLHQAFDFVPNDGRKVVWTTATDESDVARRIWLKCVTQTGSSTRPSYPAEQLRAGTEGTVVAWLHFVDPAKPPVIEVLYDGGHGHFLTALRPMLEGARLPCMGSEPVDVSFKYRFSLEGPGATGTHLLKEVTLPQYLGTVKPIPAGSAFFDTQTMKCPFDVRVEFDEPFEVNRVQELDEDVATRHAFLDWLAKLHIDLGTKPPTDVIGQTMTVHVPCATIDL